GHGACVKDHRARSRRPPFDFAQPRAQIMDERDVLSLLKRRKDPSLQLALGLLIDGVPRRQIVGHHALGRFRAMR
ncbi:hypothetical protein, partial [uncultured Chloroflexus sp.]|uniref:hypothetical protein n=1 Tax=uncultured Chloroflexus sp. TaxID=214040 RepID=UPI002635B5BB